MPPVSKHPKDTPEYFADLAVYRARRAAKKAGLEPPQSGAEETVDTDEVFDLGEPEPARMAAPERPEKDKRKKGRRRLAKGEMLKQEDVHRYIKQPLDFLAKIEGHEHWQRQDDEVAEIAGPATRIINRHPEWADAIHAFGDPGALVFACVMVLGPSVMEEIRRARGYQQPAVQQQQPAARQQRPQAPPGGGPQRDDIPGPAQVQTGAAAVIPPPPDLPSQFLA